VDDDKVGKQPDYALKALNTTTQQKGRVGSAWVNEDGSIRIILNPFVTLQASHDLILTLFKPDDGPPKVKKRVRLTASANDQPVCPLCGSAMVIRKSRTKFWGCSKYPKCRGTLSMAEEEQADQPDPEAS
jgi:ribosomal protein L37AE/L43A